MPYADSASLMQSMGDGLTSVACAFKNFTERLTTQQERRQAFDKMLVSTEELSNFFPLFDILSQEEKFPQAAFQAQSGMTWVIRNIHFLLTYLRVKVDNSHLLTGGQYRQLKKQIDYYATSCRRFETILAAKSNFPLENSTLKNSIGTHRFDTPLRLYIDDDDTGKHVSCFEIQQVYGFGENEEEALAMLDRELLSLYADLRDGTPVSQEYMMLKFFLDQVFSNEE